MTDRLRIIVISYKCWSCKNDMGSPDSMIGLDEVCPSCNQSNKVPDPNKPDSKLTVIKRGKKSNRLIVIGIIVVAIVVAAWFFWTPITNFNKTKVVGYYIDSTGLREGEALIFKVTIMHKGSSIDFLLKGIKLHNKLRRHQECIFYVNDDGVIVDIKQIKK